MSLTVSEWQLRVTYQLENGRYEHTVLGTGGRDAMMAMVVQHSTASKEDAKETGEEVEGQGAPEAVSQSARDIAGEPVGAEEDAGEPNTVPSELGPAVVRPPAFEALYQEILANPEKVEHFKAVLIPIVRERIEQIVLNASQGQTATAAGPVQYCLGECSATNVRLEPENVDLTVTDVINVRM